MPDFRCFKAFFVLKVNCIYFLTAFYGIFSFVKHGAIFLCITYKKRALFSTYHFFAKTQKKSAKHGIKPVLRSLSNVIHHL